MTNIEIKDQNLKCWFVSLCKLALICEFNLQTPDKRNGQEKVDAVLVDEESISGSGSDNLQGCGAKILRGDGALDRYISETNVRHKSDGEMKYHYIVTLLGFVDK